MQSFIRLIVTEMKMKPGITNCQFHLLTLHLLCSIFVVNTEPLVETSQGILNGTIQESRNGRIYSAFLGIPYGQPPIGNLRFASPVAAENWTGIRAANSFGNICIQLKNNTVTGSEDCLFLNVYTPILEFNSSSTSKTLLPVMVFIHGGGFIGGSSNMYGAKYLLDKEVILVTINYRLGIFGFLSTGDSAAPGNFGLKDQVLALKWVQKNIHFFGGDSNRVTLFGQSSGAASVALHAISKASNGLFQKYIIQSGANLAPWVYQRRSNFILYTRALSSLVLCPSITSAGLVNCMRRRSPATLLDTSSIFSTISRLAQLTWTPTDEPDSEDAFLTGKPENLVKNNQMKDLPFMSGVVSDEGLLITRAAYSSDITYGLLRVSIDPLIAYVGAYYLESSHLLTFTPAVNGFYFNNTLIFVRETSFLESLTKFVSDSFFFYSQLRMLEIITPKITSPNYFYNFGYRGSLSIYSQLANNTLGVGHGDELIYLFNLTSGSYQISDLNFTATDLSMSKKMVDLWTSFAIDGKPTSSELSDPNMWLPYTTQDPVHIQIGNIGNNKDPTLTMSNTFYTDRMNFWRRYAPIL